MRSLTIGCVLFLSVVLPARPVQAQHSLQAAESQILYAAMNQSDPEISQAVQLLMNKGFLKTIIRMVAATGAPPREVVTSRVLKVVDEYLGSIKKKEATISFRGYNRCAEEISYSSVEWTPGDRLAVVPVSFVVVDGNWTFSPRVNCRGTISVDTQVFSVTAFDYHASK